MSGSLNPKIEKPRKLAKTVLKAEKPESEEPPTKLAWVFGAACIPMSFGLWWASAQIWIYLDIHRPRTPHWPNIIPWRGHTSVFYANGFELLFMFALDVAALVAMGYGFNTVRKQPRNP